MSAATNRSLAGMAGLFGGSPRSWQLAPVYARFEVRLGKMLDAKQITGQHLAHYLRNIDVQWDRINTFDLPEMDFDEDDRQVLRLVPGDVLVCEGGEAGRTAIWQGELPECYYQKAIHRLRPLTDRDLPRYLFWVMRYAVTQGFFSAHGSASTIEHLPAEKLRLFRYPAPPFETQRRIADYLDRETARIDALIAATERLLTILAEKRQALVTYAVTRGLNRATPIRDSNLSWLGMIPKHWELKRLQFLAEVRTGLTIGKDYGTKELQDYPYLRVANVQDGYLALDDVTTVAVPEEEARSCSLAVGDVLMNEGGDIDKLGRGCVWRGEISPCLHQNHVFCVRPHSVSPEWLATWTATLPAKSYFETRAKRTTNLASISSMNINEIHVPLPPIVEQQAIMTFVTEGHRRLDSMSAATVRTADLLRERRSALIAAAVTGQLVVGR